MNPKEILRWVTVVGFGGFGLYNCQDLRSARVICSAMMPKRSPAAAALR
jgi:hypothetical protein